MSNDNHHPAPPPDLPTAEHEDAEKLEEAKRLEKLKASHAGSHRTAGSEELPQVHSEANDG